MKPIPFAKTTRAHFVAAWLAAAAVACDSPPVANDCTHHACDRDAASDAVKRDAPSPPDAVVPDTGPSRSAFCGTAGCFPGNVSACGSTPLPDAAFVFAARAVDDAADESEAVVTMDATPDASADTPRDAKSEESRDDGSLDASTQDASIDTGKPPDDAPEDTSDELEPEASGDTKVPPAGDADASDSGGHADASIDMGMSDEPKILQSCYIKPAATGVVTECAPVGPGVEGSACNDSHECGALLACVEVDQKAACRRVWCALPPDCLKGRYYQEAPLRVNGATRRDLDVPVCLPVDNCTLLAPQNPCPAGKVCAVVGTDGETTCMAPGSARVGEPCDETSRCSDGLLCSKSSNHCVKICHVDALPTDCPTGTCQGGNRSLPDGFGICVGQTDGG